MSKKENLTPERAVEILMAFANGSGDCLTDDLETALKMGAEAIERCMIAKEPDREIRDGLCTEYICPKCKAEIDFIKKPNYCEFCGQKLDWSDVK